eukprot:scaffold18873_cov112-Isochrysis_galbana.AAC.3
MHSAPLRAPSGCDPAFSSSGGHRDARRRRLASEMMSCALPLGVELPLVMSCALPLGDRAASCGRGSQRSATVGARCRVFP